MSKFKYLLLAVLLASPAFAAQVKVSDLPDGGSVQTGDLVPIVRSGTSYKASLSGVYFPGAGIPVSTGSSWTSSIEDNHVNWNTAYSNRITSASGDAPLSLSINSNVLSGSMPQASSSKNGWLSSTDWAFFNGKQNEIATGTTAQYLRGDLSLATFPTLGTIASQDASSVAITGGTLTGVTATGTFHGEADTVTTINGKISAGTNVSISGSGTTVSPYLISSTATGSSSTQSINTVTDSYTLVLSDAEKLIVANKATAMNVTVPPNSSVAYSTGTRIDVLGYGAGAVTIVAGSGVTIRSPLTLVLNGQYAKVQLQKIGTDEWSLEGRLQ